MPTLREVHEGEKFDFTEVIQAQILTAVIDSEEVPCSPDDIIVDVANDVFEVSKSASGDMSFASPEMLLKGKIPDQNDQNFVLGMVIHYMYQEPGNDLAMKASNSLIPLYLKDYEEGRLLLADEELAADPGLLRNDDPLGSAAVLTGRNFAARTNERSKLAQWILRQPSQVSIRFMNGGECVKTLHRDFPTDRRTNITLSKGKMLEANGAVYQIAEDCRIIHRPGRHIEMVPVRRVR